MSSCMNTVSDFGNVREAVCVSVQKIMDACRDQDCMEDIPVFLTSASQDILNRATSVKARCAELLYADVSVEPVCYREGYYTVSTQYYYRVIADAVLCAVRPATIYGLATVGKCVTLFGGEEGARLFSSRTGSSGATQPEAVVEAINPIILHAKIVDLCHCRFPDTCCCMENGLPEPVGAAFDDELVLSGMERQLQVTLGQFGLVRLQRQAQLLIPSYDYCMPGEACNDGGTDPQECPCDTFARMDFPIQAFFPQAESTKICAERCGRGDNRIATTAAIGTETSRGCCESGGTERTVLPVTVAATAAQGCCEDSGGGSDVSRQETRRTIPVTGGRKN